jgi:hypothetical protein
MISTSFAPPDTPTVEEQREALCKGYGRAMLWAVDGKLDADALLTACVCDQRFDTQLESSRGAWLWGLIRAGAYVDAFRPSILRALDELPDDRSANQLCEIAAEYALAGDGAFVERLRRIAMEKPVADSPWLAEEEYQRVAGEQALVDLAAVRGARLEQDPWGSDHRHIIERAEAELGPKRVAEWLGSSLQMDVKRFERAWQDDEGPETSTRPDPRATQRAIPVEQILAEAQGERRFHRFSHWGVFATDEAIEAVWRAVLTPGQTLGTLDNLLSVFARRDCPGFDPLLIDLCRHDDSDISWRAFIALERLTHPAIREFGIEQMRDRSGRFHAQALGLFIHNYEPGDEVSISRALILPDEPGRKHTLFLNALQLIETNDEADPTNLAILAYIHNPCSYCRGRAVEALIAAGTAPEWMIREGPHDVSDEVRDAIRDLDADDSPDDLDVTRDTP